MSKKEDTAAKMFIDTMLKTTFRICHWNENGELNSRSSGFLYQKSENSPLLVITAGHDTLEKGSFIETKYVCDDNIACINTGEFNVFFKEGELDYAYSELPIENIKNFNKENITFDFQFYKGPFVNAVKNEAYGFAVLNNYEFIKSGENFIVPIYLCHEVYLELVDQDEHFNYFKPSREIQDHEYYRGASGSPIADPSGAICSILVGGTDPIEFLRAFRLDNIDLP